MSCINCQLRNAWKSFNETIYYDIINLKISCFKLLNMYWKIIYLIQPILLYHLAAFRSILPRNLQQKYIQRNLIHLLSKRILLSKVNETTSWMDFHQTFDVKWPHQEVCGCNAKTTHPGRTTIIRACLCVLKEFLYISH